MWNEFLLCFTAIFVALDIIGTLPMYVSLTQNFPIQEKKKVVNTSMAVALGVAIVFAIIGKTLFRQLGITIPDFRIAGGLILLLISLSDLLKGPEATHGGSVSGSTGIVPLAVPLISGPAVLTTLILQINKVGHLMTLVALLLNYLIAWFVLRNSERVTRLIGKDGTVVMSKLAALLLAAIAVAMIRCGIFESLHDWMLTR